MLNPLFSFVSTCMAAVSCRWLSFCSVRVSVRCCFASASVSRCRAVVRSVVCTCRAEPVLRRVRVISRRSGGVPVTVSAGRLVSYSRMVVITSSSFACSVSVSDSIRVCRASVTFTVAELSVFDVWFTVVCRPVWLTVCTLTALVFFRGEQLERDRAIGSMRAIRYFADGFFQSCNIGI